MKTAIMFSGQGGQRPGMMQDIFEMYPVAMETFEVAKQVYSRNLYDFITNASQDELNETINTQPCMVSCQLATLRVLREFGIEYEAVVGFSLGEWSAIGACGVAGEADILSLVHKRAMAMQKAVPMGKGGMAAVLGKDEEFVRALCESIGDISPANFNCPGNISVAGSLEGIDRLMEEAEKQEIMVQRLAISIPSHCQMMKPAEDELRPEIEAMAMGAPGKELVMNATGLPASAVSEIKNNLIAQLTVPVKFQQSIELLLEKGYDTFIEIGPGKPLSGMVKRISKKCGKKVSILRMSDMETVQELAGHFGLNV